MQSVEQMARTVQVYRLEGICSMSNVESVEPAAINPDSRVSNIDNDEVNVPNGLPTLIV